MGKFITLEKSTLTKDWTIEERAALAYFLEEKLLKKSEILFHEQSQESKLYFIDKGYLQVRGGPIHIDLGPGQSLGELSLLHGTRKQVKVIALEDCRLWTLSGEAWKELKEKIPLIALRLTESIQAKMAYLLESSPPLSKIQLPHP